MKKIYLFIWFIVCLTICVVVVAKGIIFEQNCKGYLKRAADANTVELAIENLNVAIDYMEKNNLTKGYTSVLWKTPDEDIEFWYNNIKQSQIELMELSPSASVMDKTNMLMKLRETLTDDEKNGVAVTCPKGISRYPNNLLWGILLWLSIISFAIIFAKI